LLSLFFSFCCRANTYAVYLKDKLGSSFSVQHPEAFLSEKAIARRTRQQIPITETDLPVSIAYQNALKQFAVQLNYSSKWLNCLVLEASPTTIQAIKLLPFVIEVREIDNGQKSAAKTDAKFETLNANTFSDFDVDDVLWCFDCSKPNDSCRFFTQTRI
jgi:serine protease AprX